MAIRRGGAWREESARESREEFAVPTFCSSLPNVFSDFMPTHEANNYARMFMIHIFVFLKKYCLIIKLRQECCVEFRKYGKVQKRKNSLVSPPS